MSLHFLFTAPRYHTNQHFAVKALLDAGHRVSFLALRREHSEVYDALHPTILGESIATRAIQSRRIGIPPLPDFWKQMRKLNPDVVIARDPNTAYGLLSAVVGRLMVANVIFYSQTPVHRRLNWWETFMRSFPARVARARWITPLLGSPETYPPAFGALRYVPFAMEPQTAPDQRSWFRDSAINILCIGKFEERKNHRLFLQAIACLSERYPVRATIIGQCTTGEHRRRVSEIKEFQKSAGLGDRVRIKTNMSYWDVQREYGKHDLFVLPSRDEPAAVSPLEAMAHSLPVVCSDSNGTQCYIRQGENGYVFRTDDLDDLKDYMERIISDRRRLVEMGSRSYELVVSEHSPARYVEALLAIAERRE